ncbi:MAG: hypothetical protein EON54_18970 [Alcaligenaceae bacterium]|nr:MAG: hypothetical protein EON54_18970 [Alcaligenaceae bacterium]
MTPAELEALALGVAKLAFVFGFVGGIVMHMAMWTLARIVLALGRWNDRRDRIHSARVRLHG